MIVGGSPMLKLFFLILCGVVAQNDFFRFDTNFPSRTLFPFVDGTVFNIKDLVDDVSNKFMRKPCIKYLYVCKHRLKYNYLCFL